jgi:xylulose-5-phosphate/fructose-6-phosphate phosphoketolase
VINVIDNVPKLGSAAARVKERMKNSIIDHLNYACEYGVDKPEINDWRWPY